jgi:putative DNA primase/helicase
MGQAALQYVRRGWPVFPCRERDEPWSNAAGKSGVFRAKAPYTGQGLKDATRDEARVTDWWRKHPDAMIGVPMGVNDCFALDFDPRVEDIVDPDTGEVLGKHEYSLEDLKAELEAQMGVPLPQSLTAITQSGGVHVWFRQPTDGGDPIRNRGNLPDHVDVRGLGGYVVGAPSIVYAEDGSEKGRYRWYRERGDWRDDAAIAEAPAELIEILRSRGKKKVEQAGPVSAAPHRTASAPIADVDQDVRKYALSALDGEIRAIRAAGTGKRNGQLNESAFKLASLAAAGALDEVMALAAIRSAAADNPGNDDPRQLEATIQSGWAAGYERPRDLAEIAAASRSRRERRDAPRPSARPAAPARRAPAAANDQPFRSGRAEGEPTLAEGDRVRLRKSSAAWMQRRLARVERAKKPVEQLAYSIGRRISAGLIDEGEARAGLMALLVDVADLQPEDIGRSLDDGYNRGFDPETLLVTQRCAAYPMTDFGIGERFRDQFGRDFRFTTAKGWLGWDGRRWRVLDQDKDTLPAELISAVFETIRRIQDEARYIRDTGVERPPIEREEGEEAEPGDEGNPHGLDQLIPKGKNFELLSSKLAIFGRQSETAGKPAAIAQLARRWLTLPIEDFDRDPLAINVLNGTLRFRREKGPDGQRSAAMVRELHRREDLNTKLAPVEYDETAQCPAYDGFFAWAHPDAETRRYLHQAAGYSLSGDTSEQKLWFHYGLGANGKSTWMDLIAHVAGDYSGTIGIETFLDQGIKKRGEQASPDLARLGGVRLLRASEPERGSRLNEALIKAATGGEPMAVRALHRGFFDLQPLFKLHIGGNYKPDIPGTDEGIWRRMKLVPWNAHVADGDRDESLPARLRAEAAGVFNRMVQGMLDWLANGLTEPDAVREATAQYREDSDPLARFLKLCTEVDPQSRVQSSKLHEVFVAWCKAAGEKDWTQKGFSKAMTDKGFTKKASDGMQWLGMRLTKSASDFVDPATGKVVDQDGGGFLGGRAPPDDGPLPGDFDYEPL